MKHLCSPATLDLSKEVQNETSKDTFSQDFETTLEMNEWKSEHYTPFFSFKGYWFSYNFLF